MPQKSVNLGAFPEESPLAACQDAKCIRLLFFFFQYSFPLEKKYQRMKDLEKI